MISKTQTSKKLVAWLVLSVMIFALGMPAQVAQAQSASDISGHWASEQINKWIDKGYVKGYEDGSFKPNNPITRAEFSVLVNKSFNFNETTTISFKDVSANDWFYGEMAKAKAAGYMGGYEDGTIRPNAPITRQEAATVVAKLRALEANTAAANKFTDAAMIPDWSKGFIGAVVEAKFMRGYEDGSFMPTKNITRAEAVVVLNSVAEGKKEEPKEEKVTIKDIDDQKVKVDKTEDVTVKVDPKDAKIEIKNSDDKVVKATLKDDKIELKGLKEGSAKITVTATKDGLKDAEVTFKVEVEKASTSSSSGGGGGSSSSSNRPADKTELVKAINAAEVLVPHKAEYTVETWTKFEAALTDARAINDIPRTTQSRVDEVTKALNDARVGLEKPTDPEKPDPLKDAVSTKEGVIAGTFYVKVDFPSNIKAVKLVGVDGIALSKDMEDGKFVTVPG
ncbi:S-layer homology domain-containing protein, partial [Anaerophilus nitritogenes]|uniref:S-layer homology domain-containing protein n=1 Tax=Anaerophilus nitritogenes TaxID=2498136 RepID=UPI0013EC4052